MPAIAAISAATGLAPITASSAGGPTHPPHSRGRLMALAFLAHFVGDLHMPLHAGDRGDLGGNRLGANYGVIGGRTNLHSIWDGYLADRGISNPPGDAAGILSELDPAERAAASQGTVEDWSRQSWEASRDYAYATVLGDPCGPTPTERPRSEEHTSELQSRQYLV